MALGRYGVLRGKPIDRRLGAGRSPHYQVHIADGENSHRIAINVKSRLSPSEVEYLVVDRFVHPIVDQLLDLRPGFTPLKNEPGGLSLDYIRGNLMDPRDMVPLPYDVPGPDNDLNEKIDAVIQRAMADEDSDVFAFGEPWGPEGAQDKYFGFKPGLGIHNIHMNQGSVGSFVGDNGVWQDGGLLVHFPNESQWVAILLKFQSQSWHTDDKTGHRISGEVSGPPSDTETPPIGSILPSDLPTFDRPDGMVRIVAAMVNSIESPERESVTLLNTTPKAIDLSGWAIMDKQKARQALSGHLGAGQAKEFLLSSPVALSNKGGIITLINHQGLKVDGVSYTKAQAQNPGWTLVF